MKIKLIVDGGAMKPGPSVSQQLGPMGINLGKVIQEINEATSGFKGMKVPVELDVDKKTKNFTVKVSSPPVSELIKKELGLESGSGQAGKTYAGNISVEQLIGIAKTKLPGMLAKDLKAALKLTVGSCVSLGILIDSKNPKEIMRIIKSGVYDKEIKEEKTIPDPEKKKDIETQFEIVKAKQEKDQKTLEEAKAKEEAEKATATVTAATTPGATAPAVTGEAKKEGKKDAKKDDKKKK